MDGLLNEIKQLDALAEETRAVTQEVNEIAQQGGTAAANASEKMNGIKESVTSSASVVIKLGSKTQQINKVVELINSISEQTNLLVNNNRKRPNYCN